MEDALKYYIAGLVAGVATVATAQPFDTIKVQLQAQNSEVYAHKYKNAFHCTKHILATEGVKGFYRGASLSFAGVSLETSLSFGLYSQMKLALQGGVYKSGPPKMEVVIPSAACSGALIGFLLGPGELLKCRLQVQMQGNVKLPNHLIYNGPLDCALKTIKNEGMQGLFRGGLTTFLRESIGGAVFFGTCEMTRYYMYSTFDMTSKNKLKENHRSYNSMNNSKVLMEAGVGILSGGLAGIAYWLAVLPLDVVKTLIQTNPDINANRNPIDAIFMVMFIGFMLNRSTLNQIHKRHGFRGLYAGIGPTLICAFPANAAAIVAWEFTANLLGVKQV